MAEIGARVVHWADSGGELDNVEWWGVSVVRGKVRGALEGCSWSLKARRGGEGERERRRCAGAAARLGTAGATRAKSNPLIDREGHGRRRRDVRKRCGDKRRPDNGVGASAARGSGEAGEKGRKVLPAPERVADRWVPHVRADFQINRF